MFRKLLGTGVSSLDVYCIDVIWPGILNVYSTLDIGAAGSLAVMVEKDFACLDRSDQENSDAFANPQAAANG